MMKLPSVIEENKRQTT